MKSEELLAHFAKHPDAILEFEYDYGKKVRSDYHITEFKNTSISSVDCGGKKNEWQELVIQLWEPPALGSEPQMTAGKALDIINKVEENLALLRGVEVKFEYSNSMYRMAQHDISEIRIEGDKLVLNLGVGETQCKGLSSGACGPIEKVKVALSSIGGDNTCTPGGGCC